MILDIEIWTEYCEIIIYARIIILEYAFTQ